MSKIVVVLIFLIVALIIGGCSDDKKLNWTKQSENKMTMEGAIKYCEEQGGRLPTIDELKTLFNYIGKNCKVSDPDCLSNSCLSNDCIGVNNTPKPSISRENNSVTQLNSESYLKSNKSISLGIDNVFIITSGLWMAAKFGEGVTNEAEAVVTHIRIKDKTTLDTSIKSIRINIDASGGVILGDSIKKITLYSSNDAGKTGNFVAEANINSRTTAEFRNLNIKPPKNTNTYYLIMAAFDLTENQSVVFGINPEDVSFSEVTDVDGLPLSSNEFGPGSRTFLWSSSIFSDEKNYLWSTDLDDGSLHLAEKTNLGYAKCLE